MSYSLALGDNIKRNTSGNTPFNVTATLRHWHDSTKDFGGCWDGGGTYWLGDNDPLVSRDDAIGFFCNRLASHIVRSQGGNTRWEGRVTAMTLNLDGVAWRRDLAKVVNRLQLCYTSYTGNGCLDGGAEISTQADFAGITNRRQATYNGTTTYRNRRDYPLNSWASHPNYPFPLMSLSAVWCTQGKYSVYVDTSPCSRDDALYSGGVEYFTDLTAVPNSPYIVSCDVKIVNTGAYVAVAVEEASETSQGEIAYAGPGPGTFSVRQRIQTRGNASGAMRVLVMSSSATANNAQFYIDNVSLREFGVKKYTGWQEDADSIAEFGTQEEEVTVGGMTDDEALDWQDELLNNLAWPRTMVEAGALSI